MVKVVSSGVGGYNQGGPLQISAPSLPGRFTDERFTAGITAYPGLVTPLPLDTAPTTFPFWQVDWTRDTGVPSQIVSSRTSSATYYSAALTRVNGASGVPRLEYDPNTGNPVGLLLEEQRTNVYVQSDAMSSSSAGNSVITTSPTTSMDGVTKMRRVTANAVTANYPIIYQQIAGGVTASTNYLLAADVKAGTNNFPSIEWGYDDGTNQSIATQVFDLTDGSLGQTSTVKTGTASLPTISSAGAIPLGGGMYRIWMIASTGTSVSTIYLSLGMVKAKTGNTVSATGHVIGNFAGTETIDFFGADVQAGNSYSSHIVTTTAAATRSADIASSTDAGLLAAKAWLIETGGMVASTAATVLGINTGIALGVTSGNALTTADGGTQTTANTGTWTGANRSGIAWDSTPRVSIDLDGGTVVTAANTPVTPTTLYFGNTNNGASGFLNGHIRSIAAYNSLSDSDLATLSAVGSAFNIYGPAAGNGVASSVGVNTSTVVGQWTQDGVASSAGANTSTVTATWKQEGVAASAGANTSTVTATWKQEGVAASVGANTSAITSTWKQNGVASSAGTNTSTASATWLQAGVASSAGANTSSAVSAPIQSMVASSVGANTAAAVGSWLQSGVASSVGANTASVTAKWLQAGVANSAGTNTSSAYSAALPGVATSSGANTASAVGQWSQAGAVSSAGANTASGTAQWGQAGVASSIGADTAIAVGSSGAGAAADGVASSAGANVSAAFGRWTQAGVASSAPSDNRDFSRDFSDDFAVTGSAVGAVRAGDVYLSFNRDFSNDFAVSAGGSTLLDFNPDFSSDFATYGTYGARNIVSGTAVSVGSSIVSIVGAGGQVASRDFGRDFSDDFAVFGVTGAEQGVAESAGSNIAAAVGSWEVIEAPPVYPPPEPVIKQWVPANEFQRVQQPRADRVYRTAPELRRVQPLTATRTFRTGTELRRVSPSNMKRRYG